MQKVWDTSKKVREYGHVLGTLSFNDMRDTPGLQAADLLVYEFRHFYHLRETRPDLGVRFPFKVILNHRPPQSAILMTYMPGWHIDFQAKGIIAQAMRITQSDIIRWRDMYEQLQPPGVNGIDWYLRMQFRENYIASFRKYEPD